MSTFSTGLWRMINQYDAYLHGLDVNITPAVTRSENEAWFRT